MCGIWALFGHSADSVQHCDCSFSRIKHRGPDAWRIQYDSKIKEAVVGFARLAIVDSIYGMQPMILHMYPHLTLLCNGEIYNFKTLGKTFQFQYETKCDVECILQLYESKGIEFTVSQLDGVFAFVLVDTKKNKIFTARDPYGVRPLYRLTTKSGVLGLCSEGKGLIEIGSKILDGDAWTLKQFPPGHYAEYDIKPTGKTELVKEQRYYELGAVPKFMPSISYESLTNDVYANIRMLLTESVRKRLMADRRIGCLLSGGLDSSLISSLLIQEAKKINIPYKIQSFSIGMADSPDLIAARQVASHIGTEHHEVVFDEIKVAQVLETVIKTLETFDITTIRASIGMYLIAEYIKDKTDTTVIMSGEGADELCQGYIYFRNSPDYNAGHNESLRLLGDIFHYDGLRADRTTAKHSLELRVPFLDIQFTQYILSIDKAMRCPKDGVEKKLIRQAFDGTGLLPDNILWRHKEAFSDGVASVKKSLFQIIQEIVEKIIPDEALENAKVDYPHLTPPTKEALYYRQIFDKEFPGQASFLTPYYWMPKWTDAKDPSARFLKSYKAESENVSVHKKD